MESTQICIQQVSPLSGPRNNIARNEFGKSISKAEKIYEHV